VVSSFIETGNGIMYNKDSGIKEEIKYGAV
jgi:hypothetical protein